MMKDTTPWSTGVSHGVIVDERSIDPERSRRHVIHRPSGRPRSNVTSQGGNVSARIRQCTFSLGPWKSTAPSRIRRMEVGLRRLRVSLVDIERAPSCRSDKSFTIDPTITHP
jgi:hypothetical protein